MLSALRVNLDSLHKLDLSPFSAEGRDMENISTWEIALIAIVGYFAITTLVKMMIDYRDRLTAQLEEQAQKEKKRKREEAEQKQRQEQQAEMLRQRQERDKAA